MDIETKSSAMQIFNTPYCMFGQCIEWIEYMQLSQGTLHKLMKFWDFKVCEEHKWFIYVIGTSTVIS